MITKLDHVAISVADLERSLRFYRDIIGFEVIRMLECDTSTKLGEVTGMPECAARIAHLQAGDSMLELFEYSSPQGRTISLDRKQADHGLIHLGFTSQDVRGDCARLKQAGVNFISEPVEFRPGVWIVYFYGPDGEVCELRETQNE
jgi:glyoxylase I family protein